MGASASLRPSRRRNECGASLRSADPSYRCTRPTSPSANQTPSPTLHSLWKSLKRAKNWRARPAVPKSTPCARPTTVSHPAHPRTHLTLRQSRSHHCEHHRSALRRSARLGRGQDSHRPAQILARPRNSRQRMAGAVVQYLVACSTKVPTVTLNTPASRTTSYKGCPPDPGEDDKVDDDWGGLRKEKNLNAFFSFSSPVPISPSLSPTPGRGRPLACPGP